MNEKNQIIKTIFYNQQLVFYDINMTAEELKRGYLKFVLSGESNQIINQKEGYSVVYINDIKNIIPCSYIRWEQFQDILFINDHTMCDDLIDWLEIEKQKLNVSEYSFYNYLTQQFPNNKSSDVPCNPIPLMIIINPNHYHGADGMGGCTDIILRMFQDHESILALINQLSPEQVYNLVIHLCSLIPPELNIINDSVLYLVNHIKDEIPNLEDIPYESLKRIVAAYLIKNKAKDNQIKINN